MNSKKKLRTAMRPRDVADTIAECIIDKDIDSIVNFFHPDYIMPFPPTEAPKKGLDTVRAIFTSFIEDKLELISTVTGEMINGDIALLQADWHIKNSAGDITAQGKSTEILKQRPDGSWVYYIDCPMGLPSIT